MTNPIGEALILVSRNEVDALMLTLVNLYAKARRITLEEGDSGQDEAFKGCEAILRAWYAQIPLTPEEQEEQDYALGTIYPVI